MKLREWEILKQDPLLKQAFKAYCFKKNLSIIKDGAIWMETDGCIALYDWQWQTPIDLDYSSILKEYEEAKKHAELS